MLSMSAIFGVYKPRILHFCGPAYNHSYVGKVEKAHRDILDMARVMLNNSQLPRRFYSDAIQYSTYMRNRTPRRNLSLTPVELLSSVPATSYKHPSFGQLCLSFVPNELRTKLDNPYTPCRFLGYGQQLLFECILLRERDL